MTTEVAKPKSEHWTVHTTSEAGAFIVETTNCLRQWMSLSQRRLNEPQSEPGPSIIDICLERPIARLNEAARAADAFACPKEATSEIRD